MENKNSLSPKEKREKLYEFILSKNYGETITIEQINNILQENLNSDLGSKRFRNQINKVKNKLYEKGYVIRSIYDIGYYILKPNQVSSYTYRNFIVKPTKQFNKARIIMKNTNTKNLNDDEYVELYNTIELNKEMIRTTNKILNSEKNFYKKGNCYNGIK